MADIVTKKLQILDESAKAALSLSPETLMEFSRLLNDYGFCSLILSEGIANHETINVMISLLAESIREGVINERFKNQSILSKNQIALLGLIKEFIKKIENIHS